MASQQHDEKFIENKQGDNHVIAATGKEEEKGESVEALMQQAMTQIRQSDWLQEQQRTAEEGAYSFNLFDLADNNSKRKRPTARKQTRAPTLFMEINEELNGKRGYREVFSHPPTYILK